MIWALWELHFPSSYINNMLTLILIFVILGFTCKERNHILVHMINIAFLVSDGCILFVQAPVVFFLQLKLQELKKKKKANMVLLIRSKFLLLLKDNTPRSKMLSFLLPCLFC